MNKDVIASSPETAEEFQMKDLSPSYTFHKVSMWFDTDLFKLFVKTVRSGDVVELRSTKTSHWGVAVRVEQPPRAPKSKSKQPKAVPDEIMIYHLVHHSKTHRGQIGLFTVEEFWTPCTRIRINNTSNGASLYIDNSILMPKEDVLRNAYKAYRSTSLKWQTCTDFIRWCCEHDYFDDLRSCSSLGSRNSSAASNRRSPSSSNSSSRKSSFSDDTETD